MIGGGRDSIIGGLRNLFSFSSPFGSPSTSSTPSFHLGWQAGQAAQDDGASLLTMTQSSFVFAQYDGASLLVISPRIKPPVHKQHITCGVDDRKGSRLVKTNVGDKIG